MIKAGCSSEDAEDIAQITMVTVWHRAALFDPMTTGAAAWIFTIMRNRRIDAVRRQSRDRPTLLGSDLSGREYEPSPEATTLRDEDHLRVRAALKKLSPEQSKVIQLSFLEERPHPEIAHELDLPLGTVKSRIRLAMRRLKNLLENN